MLTIHRLTSDRADYYLSDLARELPLSPDDHAGRWVGRGAGALDLDGRVRQRQFTAALQGRHPATGYQLRSERATVLGYDLTFSAPKSASVLFGLGGVAVARQVHEGHVAAVQGAVDYLDGRAVTVTRRHGSTRDVLPTGGLVAGAFTHGVNRNADPHLHTHVVMANLAHGEDSRWSAIDQRGLWAHQHAAAAIYDSHLRYELTARLGVQWKQAPFARAEINGASPLLVGEFSSRAADIRRHGFEHGARSARGNRIAWAVTRPPKGEGVEFVTLVPRWHQRATAALGSPPVLTPMLGHRPPERATLSEHQFAGVLSIAPDGVRRRDVVAAFAQSARHGAPASTVRQLTDLWAPGAAAVGVAEPVQPRAGVVPAPHLLRTLGPRPLDVSQHEVWREAAGTIDAYRHRWQVTVPEALGAEQCQPRWPAARIVDHLRTASFVQAARARLGCREPMVVELGRGR